MYETRLLFIIQCLCFISIIIIIIVINKRKISSQARPDRKPYEYPSSCMFIINDTREKKKIREMTSTWRIYNRNIETINDGRLRQSSQRKNEDLPYAMLSTSSQVINLKKMYHIKTETKNSLIRGRSHQTFISS